MDGTGGFDALVRRAQRNDAAAWETIYRRAYPRLYSYARRRLPGDDAARDAVADTMARAVRGIASYRGDGNGFDAWLAGIVRHVVLDAQRRRRRKPEAGVDLGGRGVDRSDPSVVGPAERVVQVEEETGVRAAFAALPEADREVLELRVVLGLSAEEVAEVLGKRPGAVRMAQSRALARLRALLTEEEAVHGA